MDNENNYVKVFDEIPGRVTAAMGFLCHCKQITDPCCPDSAVQNARSLTASEQATADAALGLLRSYFLGEADLGGPPVLQALPEQRDEPKTKANETSGGEEPKPTLSSRMAKWFARWPWIRR
ncbi:MAG: hypothetical protein IT432_12620 [Phycisphaerales bacterium]|nr:hypothetical protein [Phycisphaerales bacterium]